MDCVLSIVSRTIGGIQAASRLNLAYERQLSNPDLAKGVQRICQAPGRSIP